MPDVSAKLVMELRSTTGAGMMDCKKALQATNGNLEEAVAWLRQKGLAGAAKKAGRVAAEGLVGAAVAPDGRQGCLIEVNCETDFVARNEAFKTLLETLAEQAVTVTDVETLKAQPYAGDPSQTVEEATKQAIAQLGENIQIRRLVNFAVPEGTFGRVGSYIHTGGQIGVLVQISADKDVSDNPEFQGIPRLVAMQIAACPNVSYVSVEQIPAEISEREKAIEMGKDDLASKPPAVREKIIQGRIAKRLQEMSLLNQPYIKDQSITVEELLKQLSKSVGATVKVDRFERFILGEGIDRSAAED
ncbi:MAG: translation elongation factor Ts [Thermostichales cyanobacterium SZTDM-1c_bins_54]